MPDTPKRFEDEYPDGAAALVWFYGFPARFRDHKGRLHKLPCYLYCGKDYCQHIEFV